MRLAVSGRLVVTLACLLILVPMSGIQGKSLSVAVAATHPTGGPPSGTSVPVSRGSGEIAALRTRTSRTYLLNGHYVAQISAQSMNYRDASGAWQPIDDSLTSATTPGFAYQNKANRYTVSFPADLSKGPIREQTSAGWIQFSLVGLSGPGSVSGNTDTFTIPGGSIAFQSQADQLKESISLAGPSSPSSFSYDLAWSGGLTARKTGAGGIDFADRGGKVQMSLDPPTMRDAAGATSSAVTVTLTSVSSTSAALTVSADRTWLAASGRRWPVVIDPSISLADVADTTCTITSNGTYTDCGLQAIEVGWFGSSVGIERGILQFDTSSIPSNATVLNADMQLWIYGNANAGPVEIDAYGLTQAHTHNATWTKYDGTNLWTTPGGTYDASTVWKNPSVGPSTTVGYDWYPTSLVQGWVNGSKANDGILLKSPNENPTSQNYVWFDKNSPHVPSLTVTYQPYTPSLGIQGWYTFAGPVNVANGNLVLSGADMSMPGVGLDNSVGTTYNSLSTGTGDVGNGWLLDVGQDVNLSAFGDGSELFTGPTGFQAEFMSNGSGGYTSPPGMDADLVKNGDGTFTLTDHGSGVKMSFSTGGIPTSVTDRSGNTITYGYVSGTTRLSSITDTLGGVTSLTYDANNRLTQIQDPANRLYKYAYDASGNLISYTDPMGNVTQYAYDTNNLLTQITDPKGNITKISYDSSRRATSITNVTVSSSGTGPTTSYSYASGQTSVTDPNSHTTTFSYDNQGRATAVTDPANHTVQLTWTSDNHVATSTLPSGIKTTNGYDAKNNLTSVTTKSASGSTSLAESWSYTDSANPYLATAFTDTQGNATSYTYDSAGRLLTVSDPQNAGKQTSYAYDSHGNVTTETDENGHVTSHTYTSLGMPLTDTPPAPLGQTSYTFNSYNLEATVTDGNSQQTQYTYTADGDVSAIHHADAATTCPSTAQTVSLCYTFDANGNVTSMTDATGTTSYTYNALDQLVAEQDPNTTLITCPGTSIIASVCYTYDAGGNLTSKQDSDGTTSYTYNADDSLASVTDRNNKQTTFHYDQDGNLTSETLPNGVVQSLSYDALDRLANIGAKNSGGTQLTSFGFSYNKAAVSSVTDVNGNTTSYSYNADNALTGATQKNSLGVTLNSYAYGYDPVGNLTSKTVNGLQTSFTYNAADELTQASGGMIASYSYNGQGDLTSRTVNGISSSFTYNAGGQMTSLNGTAMTYTGIGETQRVGAGSTSYQYDASGMRKQVAGGTSVGGQPLPGSTASTFTTLPDGSLVSETVSGSTYYYLSDGMGNVAALVDSTGAIADQYAYDPMGNITSSSGVVSNPFTFQGWTYDAANNLYYTGSGYYDPATGQMIGCKDKGWVDPGEDNCGEDENPACGGTCSGRGGTGTGGAYGRGSGETRPHGSRGDSDTSGFGQPRVKARGAGGQRSGSAHGAPRVP